MYETSYARPATLAEAVALLQGDDEAKCLAGGMTYVPTLKQRLASPSLLVDLAEVLPRDIVVGTQSVTIGAGARHVDVQRHAGLCAVLPALCDLAGLIGDPMVRNRGTIGGSLANNDPAADYPAAALALDAEIETTGRRLGVAAFLTGMFETALEPDEIVTRVQFRRPLRAAYRKFANKASGYAVAGVFVAEFADGVRVGVTGAGPCAFRHEGLERALTASFGPASLDGVRIDPEGLLSDMHADAGYRTALVLEMARQAVQAIAG